MKMEKWQSVRKMDFCKDRKMFGLKWQCCAGDDRLSPAKGLRKCNESRSLDRGESVSHEFCLV